MKMLHDLINSGSEGYYLGKSDQRKTQNAITEAKSSSDNQTNAGINDTQNRVNTLTDRSDSERANINSGFQQGADTGWIDPTLKDRLLHGGGGNSSGGGSGGGGGVSGLPDYLQAYYDMQGKTGGFDPTRLGNINSVTDKLRNTSGNFGATNTSIGGLQDFAKSGGVSADNISKIDNPTLEEFSRTGGYSDADKGNIRARSNAGVSSIYTNMKDSMNRGRIASGNMSPGFSSAGFKLARQAAQDQGTNLRNTEADIAEKVRTGRMDASSTLADKMLGLSGLQSQNTLSGYKSSGDLDIAKNKQISDDLANSGNLDLNTQMGINQTRLGATNGISNDTLGRMSIGASSSAAQAALDAANTRFLISSEQGGKEAGNRGLLDTYGTAPAELMGDQNLLRGYRQDQFGNNSDLIGARIGASRIPGIGSTIGAGLDNVGKIAGIGSGIMGGFGNMGGGFGGYGTGSGRTTGNWEMDGMG
jgi:hypothetical protein